MRLDQAPMSIVGRKIRIQGEDFDYQGYVISFCGEVKDFITQLNDPTPVPVGPPAYEMVLQMGATTVRLENLTRTVQITLD